MNEFQIWTIMEYEQNFEFKQVQKKETNLEFEWKREFEQISDLNNFQIWTVFKFEQFFNPNKFQI
jgi:hypothetical protein